MIDIFIIVTIFSLAVWTLNASCCTLDYPCNRNFLFCIIFDCNFVVH